MQETLYFRLHDMFGKLELAAPRVLLPLAANVRAPQVGWISWPHCAFHCLVVGIFGLRRNGGDDEVSSSGSLCRSSVPSGLFGQGVELAPLGCGRLSWHSLPQSLHGDRLTRRDSTVSWILPFISKTSSKCTQMCS
jgi:hypothetical protein